jgi:hypothetical protein
LNFIEKYADLTRRIYEFLPTKMLDVVVGNGKGMCGSKTGMVKCYKFKLPDFDKKFILKIYANNTGLDVYCCRITLVGKM